MELYYNSNQYTHTLLFLLGAFESPFAMYEAMADFYESRGHFTNNPARVYRYQVLLQFAEEYDGAYEDVYRELLTYDMYLRENLKSRPAFAADLTEEATKQIIKEFYRQEETERKYLSHYVGFDWKQLSKMTHLEPFSYPVWDIQKLREMRQRKVQVCNHREDEAADGEIFVLFDYKVRNPLTYEAKTCVMRL